MSLIKPAASFPIANQVLPTAEQRKWLVSALTQPGGKLPLVMAGGERVSAEVVNACLAAGWVEPWVYNPLKAKTMVCRLTDLGKTVASKEAIIRVDFSLWRRDTSSSEAVVQDLGARVSRVAGE